MMRGVIGLAVMGMFAVGRALDTVVEGFTKK